MKTLSPTRLLAMVAALALAAGLLSACGSDDKGKSSDKGNATEAAFLKGMIPHHESAVEMAEVARQRGEHPQIKQLGENITTTQKSEIKQMESIYKVRFGKEVLPDPGAHEELGISAQDAGMDHMDMAAGLQKANPFDRAFIDEMVPHHQGAIRMARIVAAKSDHAPIKRLAASIIRTQSKEIAEMNDWRTKWYGAASPAGGVPAATSGSGAAEPDGSKQMDDMKHEGH